MAGGRRSGGGRGPKLSAAGTGAGGGAGRAGDLPPLPPVPADVASPGVEVTMPWPEMEDWARRTFIGGGAPLRNPDHDPLEWASVHVLVTNTPYTRKGRAVLGMAERGTPAPGRSGWERARILQQHSDWWGYTPDFVLTFDGPWIAENVTRGGALGLASVAALVEHELYHCALAGYTMSGEPKWAIRGHDVEEFIGVVRRYGADAAGPAVERLARAALEGPEIAAASLTARGMGALCGTVARAA